MFLLPSLLLGLIFAVLLGGNPARLADVRFRISWTVPLALVVQVGLFSPLGEGVPTALASSVHLASYALLLAFAAANYRIRAFAPVLLGLLLNAIAVAANGGRMPVWPEAAEAAGLDPVLHSNVSENADRLSFLGDVFSMPRAVPLANVFSVGDLLIGFGMAVFLVVASMEDDGERILSLPRLLQPLRMPAYRRLAAGRLVSMVGDWFTMGALVGWIYTDTRSTGAVAGLLLVRLAPPILGGGVAAVVVDRLPKERLLVAVEVARAGAVAGALVSVLTHQQVGIFVAVAISGGLAALPTAAIPALLPSMLPAEQLPAANAELGLSADAARALGALGAGTTLALIGAPAALLADIATFAVAAALYWSLSVSGVRLTTRPRQDSPLAGLRYLLRHRRLLVLVFSFASATVATGLANATLPRYLEDVGLGPGGYGFGIAALGVGLALGGLLVGLTRVGPSAGRWIGAALVVMSGLFAALALVEHAPTALLLLAAIGFVDGTTDILFDTVVQREADPDFYGSVFGFASAFFTTTMVAAIALAPVANDLLASNAVILGASIFLVLAGLIALVGMRSPSVLLVFESAEQRT